MTQSSTVKTRVLVISDTHSALPYPPDSNVSPFRSPLPRADVLLHCGDLTMVGKFHEYERALELLSSIEADHKFVIAGNHDISLDERYYSLKGQYMQRLKEPDNDLVDKSKELWTGQRAKDAGVTYLEEGTYSFDLNNGAKLRLYASPYQPEFCDWAFPYWPNQDRYNPPDNCTPKSEPIAVNPIPDIPAIDIMMTHGPPKSIRDATTRNEHVGCPHLLRAARRCRPLLHCFGHIHESWGAERITWNMASDLDHPIDSYITKKGWVPTDASQLQQDKAAYVDISKDGARPLERGKETLCVNASIMTVQYRAVQGAWVVDLDLERVEQDDVEMGGMEG